MERVIKYLNSTISGTSDLWHQSKKWSHLSTWSIDYYIPAALKSTTKYMYRMKHMCDTMRYDKKKQGNNEINQMR